MIDPKKIETVVLESSTSRVQLLNLGCITQSWQFSNWSPNRSAVLGYKKATDYIKNPNYFGAVIGRVANRIEGAAFSLGCKQYALEENAPPNSLHGGWSGLSKQIWAMDTDGEKSAQFQYFSPHLEGGYPADVNFTVTIRLERNTVHYTFNAEVSEPTPINLTQHNYYNLGRKNTIWGHYLTIPAKDVLHNNSKQIPLERTLVDCDYSDFRSPKRLDKADKLHTGIDLNFCLNPTHDTRINLISETCTKLSLHLDQPGLQLYSGANIQRLHTPFGNQNHIPFSGLCLEPQGYPNAVNRPDFPSIITTPDKPYSQTLSVSIEPDENHD